ncbi:N-acetylmuramoyl-L-alanine amidase [Polaromonas sp. P2-4]|nr:N-acetylmuramoyl-L-alanine amidase [Polaromonas sp. P2-4]
MSSAASGSGIGQAIGRVGEALRDCKIIDLTAQSDRSVRKGTRDPKSVYALVLHQMACCFRRRDPLRSYLRIKAHFAILPEGQILQLHPVSALIWASHGFNSKSVAVEFAGNFPNVRGRWWKGETYGRDRVTPAQLEAGRCLVRHLVRTMGLRVVLAHRQSSNMRENDPGPDIWYHVGQWAVDTLRLSDGGPGLKIGTGNPIPDAWRTWGRSGTGTPVAPELEFAAPQAEQAYEDEDEYEGEEEYESGDELWRGEPEGEVAPGLLTLAAAIADPRGTGPGVYTLYKNGQRLYVGRSNNLRRRMQQHLWCLTHLKLGVGRFHVKLTPMRGATPAQLGRVEAAVIDRFGRKSQGGPLTNVKARELEQELWGEAWR